MQKNAETLSKTEARQGLRGKPVMVVLVVSTILAIAGLALSGIFADEPLTEPETQSTGTVKTE